MLAVYLEVFALSWLHQNLNSMAYCGGLFKMVVTMRNNMGSLNTSINTILFIIHNTVVYTPCDDHF